MAAVLGVRLAETVSEKLEILLSQHTLWSDSMDVIYWIQGHSRRLKPFVANRVAEIQRKSDPAQWRHHQSLTDEVRLKKRTKYFLSFNF